jgi:hypothetical protein
MAWFILSGLFMSVAGLIALKSASDTTSKSRGALRAFPDPVA